MYTMGRNYMLITSGPQLVKGVSESVIFVEQNFWTSAIKN